MKKRKPSDPPLSAIKDYDTLDSVWSALEARPAVLASRLRDGKASRVEIQLAADLIEGKIKPRRPRRGWSRHNRLQIAEYVARLEKILPHVAQRKVQRKAIMSRVVEKYKLKDPRRVYEALAEFDGEALAQSRRMYRTAKDYGQQHLKLEPPERSEELREEMKDFGHDLLVEIIEDLLAEKEQ